MSEKATKAQASLLRAMGFRSNALRNGDEHVPMWWIEGGGGVKANTAESVVKRGWVKFTGKWGGQPGILGYTITPAGRKALEGSHD